MGCDIHSFVERKENDKWIAVAGKNPYYGKWSDEREYVYEGWIYDNRHYLFFAFLADVRNYGDIVPLSEPKGCPEDASLEVRKYIDENHDLHSASYFTLKEFEEADLSQDMVITRMVANEDARAYREYGTIPTSWCASTNQRNYETLTWTAPLKDEVKDTLQDIITKLVEIADKYELNHEDVRFVFAFDN